MNIHARDRRKWFVANFGRSYFKSQPLVNPSGLIGFALPCVVVLLVCAAALMAHTFTIQPDLMAFIPLAGIVGAQSGIEKLRKNKTDWTAKAKEMLEAANTAGGFTEETRKSYEDLKAKIEKNNELLTEMETLQSTPASSDKQIIKEAAEAERANLIEAGKTAERSRVQIINETVAALRLPQSFASEHVEKGTGVDVFRALAIDEAKKQEMAIVPGVDFRTPADDPRLRDETDERRFAFIGALLERFEPKAWVSDPRERNFTFNKGRGQKMYDGSRRFVGLSLLDVAKECLTNVGIRWQTKDLNEIVRLGFQSTSDFPYILAATANKTLRAGYDLAPSQWRLIAARRTANDFKTMYELTLDSSSRLEVVPESGEFARGALIEGRESYKLATYGKIIAITRQAIINDDLGAFTRVPFLLGQEVADLEADTVIGIITTNGNLADAVALFEEPTYHKNYNSTGAAIEVSSISALRTKMMLQTGSGGKTLGLVPMFLLAPATKATLAEQYCSPNYQAAQSSNINPFAGKLTPIIEARLDGTSTTAWYLFADPNSANGVVLVYAYLKGQEGPYTETRQGFDVDGTEIKIRHDFAAAAVDYRGAAKQVGA